MILGTTFSHRHISSLSLSVNEAFLDLLSYSFNLIRLCVYWDEVQKTEDTFDFSSLITLLDICEKQNQKVVVTIGMKAPRWPEYFIPSFFSANAPESIEQPLMRFLKTTVTTLKQYECITHWQVENEPLDPSGKNNWAISPALLTREIACVKSMDSRPCVVTLWGNDIQKRHSLSMIPEITDIVGIDIYYKRPTNPWTYTGPETPDRYFKDIHTFYTKPLWITELQAEPWENGQVFTKKANPQSMNPQLLEENYVKAKNMNPEVLLFWGYEYWYWKKVHGDTAYCDVVKKISEGKIPQR